MDKIKTWEEISLISEKLRNEGKKVVATNGCFDILHVAHVNLLEKAKREGDCLIVMLNSDASIKSFKSRDRPIISEKNRARVLSALESVDYVVLFEEDDPLELIREIKPHKIVKGGSFIPERVESHRKVLDKWGGELVHFPLEEGHSSSNIIEKIRGL